MLEGSYSQFSKAAQGGSLTFGPSVRPSVHMWAFTYAEQTRPHKCRIPTFPICASIHQLPVGGNETKVKCYNMANML